MANQVFLTVELSLSVLPSIFNKYLWDVLDRFIYILMISGFYVLEMNPIT